ncbi:hypothetical protein ACQJBY_056493 [Aegilops geniculata]
MVCRPRVLVLQHHHRRRWRDVGINVDGAATGSVVLGGEPDFLVGEVWCMRTPGHDAANPSVTLHGSVCDGTVAVGYPACLSTIALNAAGNASLSDSCMYRVQASPSIPSPLSPCSRTSLQTSSL